MAWMCAPILILVIWMLVLLPWSVEGTNTKVYILAPAPSTLDRSLTALQGIAKPFEGPPLVPNRMGSIGNLVTEGYSAEGGWSYALLLSQGRLVAEGAPAEIATEALIAAHYGAEVRVLQEDGAVAVIPVRRR